MISSLAGVAVFVWSLTHGEGLISAVVAAVVVSIVVEILMRVIGLGLSVIIAVLVGIVSFVHSLFQRDERN